MNRWSRIVISLATLSTAAWVGAGWLGYRVHDQPTLFVHTLVSFAALLGIVLCQGWILTFALVSVRLVRARCGRGGEGALRVAARARCWCIAAASTSTVVALLLFVVSNALYPARLATHPHAESAVASLVVLLAALLVEARMLSRHGHAMARIEAEHRASAC